MSRTFVHYPLNRLYGITYGDDRTVHRHAFRFANGGRTPTLVARSIEAEYGGATCSPGASLGILRREAEGGARRATNVALDRLKRVSVEEIDEYEPEPTRHRHGALWDIW